MEVQCVCLLESMPVYVSHCMSGSILILNNEAAADLHNKNMAVGVFFFKNSF
jgi:hypothetical protein